jgi:REP element-mobilizing transposase RayT
LGDVVDDEVQLNAEGHIVEASWHDLLEHYGHVRLDAFIIMPNHAHGIIILDDYPDVGAGLRPAPTVKRAGLPEIIRAFKTFSARRINEILDSVGTPFWQRGYYEHIIRNERELHAMRQYIADNPARWTDDPEHPGRNPQRYKSPRTQ